MLGSIPAPLKSSVAFPDPLGGACEGGKEEPWFDGEAIPRALNISFRLEPGEAAEEDCLCEAAAWDEPPFSIPRSRCASIFSSTELRLSKSEALIRYL